MTEARCSSRLVHAEEQLVRQVHAALSVQLNWRCLIRMVGHVRVQAECQRKIHLPHLANAGTSLIRYIVILCACVDQFEHHTLP